MISQKGLDLLHEIDEKMDATDVKTLGISSEEAEALNNLLDRCRG
jgi:hypothetical protein